MQTAAAFDNDKLFDPLGHLTDEGLRALTDGTLDELGRLEASEHLSFCDYCLARYTALIEVMPQSLQTPMRDLVPQMQALMRRRSFRIFTNRYFSAAAAVVLAFLMWRVGVFGVPAAVAVQDLPQPPAASETAGWGETVRGALDGFSAGLGEAFSQFQTLARSGLDQLNDVLEPGPEALPAPKTLTKE